MTNPRIDFSLLDSFYPVKSAPSAFTGATGNSRGDKDGTSAALTLYTVTGDVLVRIWGVCTTLLTEESATAKLEVGVVGNTAYLIAQSDASAIDANEMWFDTTPAIGDALTNVPGPFIVPNSLDIIETTSAKDINSGQVYYIALWKPLSPDGKLVAA